MNTSKILVKTRRLCRFFIFWQSAVFSEEFFRIWWILFFRKSVNKVVIVKWWKQNLSTSYFLEEKTKNSFKCYFKNRSTEKVLLTVSDKLCGKLLLLSRNIHVMIIAVTRISQIPVLAHKTIYHNPWFINKITWNATHENTQNRCRWHKKIKIAWTFNCFWRVHICQCIQSRWRTDVCLFRKIRQSTFS